MRPRNFFVLDFYLRQFKKNIQAAESEEIALSGTMPPIEKMDARLDSNLKTRALFSHYLYLDGIFHK